MLELHFIWCVFVEPFDMQPKDFVVEGKTDDIWSN